MKYDRNMGESEFIDLTLDLGYWFPWRLCGSPFFRHSILEFLEGENSFEEIKNYCDKYGYNFRHIVGKDGQPPSKEACQEYKNGILSYYQGIIDRTPEEKESKS